MNTRPRPYLRRFFVFCLALSCLCVVATTTFATGCFEPFANATSAQGSRYEPGSFLFDQTNAFGNVWYPLTNTPAPPATGFPKIVAGSLSYPGLPESAGNSISIPAATGVMGRMTLDFAVKSGSLYFSFLVKVTDLTGVGESGEENNYFAGFGDTTGPQNAALVRTATKVLVKKSGQGFKFGVGRNSNRPKDWIFDTQERAVGQTLFVVGRYDYREHTASLWIDPAASTFATADAPPPTITAERGADLNRGGIRAFVLGCRTNIPPGCIVDELRIGTTWNFVTGGLDVALEPESLIQDAGNTATFSAKGISSHPVRYQWTKNGVDVRDDDRIRGARTGMLTIHHIEGADVGNYAAVISDGARSVKTRMASLKITDPAITNEPASQVLAIGGKAVFHVGASGTAPIKVQWRKDGMVLADSGRIAGAQSDSLTIDGLTSGDQGAYDAQVINGRDLAITSRAANLYVTTSAKMTSRPNVIFILCDDLGYGDLGVLFQNSRRPGQPRERTPNLDTFAAEGMQLRQHYCPAPLCAPSRASLVLGVTQGHANVRNLQFDKALENNHTIGSVMQAAGYATALIGKWGMGGDDIGGTTPAEWAAYPTRRGFDYFFGYERHGDGHDHYPKEAPYANRSKQVYDGTVNITPKLDKCYTTDLFTARAKKWIIDQRANHPDQPFFVELAFDTPHSVYELPTSAYPAGGGVNGGVRWLGEPGHMINTARGKIDSYIYPEYANATYDDDHNPATPEVAWPEVFKRFASGVRRIDDAVGDVKKLLEDLNIETNTLVIFTSDNGPTIEDALHLKIHYAANFFDNFGPLDGIKRDSFEGGIRMPTFVRWPGRVPAGVINYTPSQFQDWMATFADLAGLPAPARTDGVSLLPTLTGHGVQQPSTVYVEYFDPSAMPNYAEFEPAHRKRIRNQMQVIGLDGYQGVRYNIKSANDNFEIYDVVHDTKEATNLASRPGMSDLQQRMKDLALQERRPNATAPRPYDKTLVPPSRLVSATNGFVNYAVYQGVWPWVPDTAMLTSVTNGRVAGFDLSVRPAETNYAIEFTGYLRIPTDGNYTFHLRDDAGALFRIHEAIVIDDDFNHAENGASGSILLKAGLHAFRLIYRHRSGPEVLDLEYSGPGIAREKIPVSACYASCPGCPVHFTAANDAHAPQADAPLENQIAAPAVAWEVSDLSGPWKFLVHADATRMEATGVWHRGLAPLDAGWQILPCSFQKNHGRTEFCAGSLFSGNIDSVQYYGKRMDATRINALFTGADGESADWRNQHFDPTLADLANDEDGNGALLVCQSPRSEKYFVADSPSMQFMPQISAAHPTIHFAASRAGYEIDASNDLRHWQPLHGGKISTAKSKDLPGFSEVVYRADAAELTAQPLYVRVETP